MPETITNILGLVRKSLSFKLLFLGGLLLFLLIPIGILGLLRESRADRAQKAEQEIGGKWGGVMHVESPLLIASLETEKQTKDGKVESETAPFFIIPDRSGARPSRQYSRRESETAPFFIIPEDLKAECALTPEVRHRGIYQAILYQGKLHLTGTFQIPEEMWKPEGKIRLNNLRLACAFSNPRAVKNLSVKLNGQELLSNPDSYWRASRDFYVNTEKTQIVHHGERVSFDITLELKGNRRFLFEPVAQHNEIALKSSWRHPCFFGSALPEQRELSDNGFEASWSYDNLEAGASTHYPLYSNESDPVHTLHHYRVNVKDMISGNAIGVELMLPVDKYLQVERVQKYSFLVVAIILIAFLIGERLTGIWVHPLQYLFIGASLVTFYLLLLALSEHMLFGLSYLLSVLVTAGMVTAYSRAIFARKRFSALILGGSMLLAYGLVYLVIGLEDFALLFGTFVVLLLLGILMAFTRKLNADAKE